MYKKIQKVKFYTLYVYLLALHPMYQKFHVALCSQNVTEAARTA